MRLYLLALSFGAIIAALAVAQPASANIMIVIDKSAQKMTVTINGEGRYIWPVSTGRNGYDTPNGDFQPFRMEKDHFSREWDDAPMPNSIFFTKIGHAIHGTFEARNLGRPVSHGCVRLSTQNAATLYALVKEQGVFNTRVRLTGETPKIEKPDDAVARRDRSNGNDRETARARENTDSAARTPDRDAARKRDYMRNYATNNDDGDDAAAVQPQQRSYQTPYGSRSYYYYRESPYYRSSGRALFSNGW
jgi:hypothetical protein